MATSNQGFVTTLQATADLSTKQYYAIAIDGNVADNSDEAIGILMDKPAASGRFMNVKYAGESKFFANEAIIAGSPIGVAAGGGFVVVSSTDTDAAVGVCKAAVTSGSIGTGYFGFASAIAPSNVSMPVTAADPLVNGHGYSLADNKVADTNIECNGLAQGAIATSGTGRIVLSGICQGTIGGGDAAAGVFLKCTGSGFLAAMTTGTNANAMALEAITSGSTGMVFAFPGAILLA